MKDMLKIWQEKNGSSRGSADTKLAGMTATSIDVLSRRQGVMLTGASVLVQTPEILPMAHGSMTRMAAALKGSKASDVLLSAGVAKLGMKGGGCGCGGECGPCGQAGVKYPTVFRPSLLNSDALRPGSLSKILPSKSPAFDWSTITATREGCRGNECESWQTTYVELVRRNRRMASAARQRLNRALLSAEECHQGRSSNCNALLRARVALQPSLAAALDRYWAALGSGLQPNINDALTELGSFNSQAALLQTQYDQCVNGGDSGHAAGVAAECFQRDLEVDRAQWFLNYTEEHNFELLNDLLELRDVMARHGCGCPIPDVPSVTGDVDVDFLERLYF